MESEKSVANLADSTMPSPTNAVDLLVAAGTRKFFIAKIVILVTFSVIGVCLLIPNRYTAITLVMPPQQSQSSTATAMAAIAGITGGLLGGGGSGAKTIEQTYVELLQSSSIRTAVIAANKLDEVYETKTSITAQRRLASQTQITPDRKSGLIKLSYTDTDPIRAAKVTNSYVEELQKLLNRLGVTEAQQRRLYFEAQLGKIKSDLSAAETRFKELQNQSGLASIDAQAQSAITAISSLRAQILSTELDISARRSYATEENPDLKRSLSDLAAKKNFLAKLEAGTPGATDKSVAPQNLEAVKSFRELKFQETLYGIMAQQYYLAVADAAKDAPLVQQIDKATPPELKSYPPRSLIVVVAFILSTLLSVIYVMLLEYKRLSSKDSSTSTFARLLCAWGLSRKKPNYSSKFEGSSS